MAIHGSHANRGVLLVVEDNPSSLADWFLTRAAAYANSLDLELFCVKNLSCASVTPISPMSKWFESLLGPSGVIGVRFGEKGWREEVVRELVGRTSGTAADRCFVTTAFDDYVNVTLQLAEFLNAEHVSLIRPHDDREWSIKNKSEVRSRWRRQAEAAQKPSLIVQSCIWRTGSKTERDNARKLVENCEHGVAIKPLAMGASLGVTSAGTMQEIESRIEDVLNADFPEELQKNGIADRGAILEEFVEGPEFSIEAAVQNGCACVLGIHEKHTGNASGVEFAELAHVFPARNVPANEVDAFRSILDFCVGALDVANAVVHLEVKRVERGLVPIEIGLRPAGDRIPLLMSLATNGRIDLIDLHLRAGLGLPLKVETARASPSQSRAILSAGVRRVSSRVAESTMSSSDLLPAPA